MKIASVADVKAHFSAYLKDSEQGPVVVTRNGRPVAVLIAAGNEEELERLVLSHSPRLRAILDAAQERIRSGTSIPHDAIWQDLETGGVRAAGPAPGSKSRRRPGEKRRLPARGGAPGERGAGESCGAGRRGSPRRQQ